MFLLDCLCCCVFEYVVVCSHVIVVLSVLLLTCLCRSWFVCIIVNLSILFYLCCCWFVSVVIGLSMMGLVCLCWC